MNVKNKISLTAALLISINIIIGAGGFLNIRPLTQIAGPLGFACYALGALVLLPFAYSLGKLAQAHPVAGGLYVFSKTYLHPFCGFLSGWIYFVGKTVSAAFLANAFVTFFQQQFVFLQQFPTLLLSALTIFSLIFLNLAGVHIGGRIQYLFSTAKGIPLLFGIIFGLFYLRPENFCNALPHFTSTFSALPITLYGFMGFEATCAIGHMIENPKKNLLRVIFGSFLFAAVLYILFQAALFGALGSSLLLTADPISHLADKIFSCYAIGKVLSALIFASVISSSFGILSSNYWNLHTLMQNNHLPGKKFFSQPAICLIAEGVLACILLAITKNQIALQSMSVFGVVFSFLLCAFAAFAAARHKQLSLSPIIPLLAIASCSYILVLCFQRIIAAGVSLPYLFVLLSGVTVAIRKAIKFS